MTVALVLAIVGVYGLELASGDAMGLCRQYGLVAGRPSIEAVVTATFFHASLSHLAGNVVALALFGTVVERSFGHLRFVALFVLGAFGAAMFHVMADPASLVPEVGASGAIFAIMAAAAVVNPRLVGFVVSFAAINVWQTFTGSAGDVATCAHLGGFATGFLFVALSRLRGRVLELA